MAGPPSGGVAIDRICDAGYRRGGERRLEIIPTAPHGIRGEFSHTRKAGVPSGKSRSVGAPRWGRARPPTEEPANVNLPEDLIAALRQPSPCFLATVMPDGSPQLTQTWVDTDGEHVVINSVQSHQKVKNVVR